MLSKYLYSNTDQCYIYILHQTTSDISVKTALNDGGGRQRSSNRGRPLTKSAQPHHGRNGVCGFQTEG